MYHCIKNFVCFLCILVNCNLNFIFRDGNPNFVTASIHFPTPQLSVLTGTKSHALYLTIHLDPAASPRRCYESILKIKKFVGEIRSRYLCQMRYEILSGIGFGFDFFKKISPDFLDRGVQNYEYRERSGKFGKMPKTGGDIFVHAKCDDHGILFELAKSIIGNMPPECVTKFEDIYGWTYRDERDLSGFVDGTMNPKDRNERAEVAINIRTGGSYALVQKWIHNMNLLRRTPDEVKEKWIGRTIENSFELRNKPITSHIARMIGSAISGTIPRYRLVRQSQPYGTLSGENGLLFMAYALSTENFDYMLDRMTGHADDHQNDDVMRFSRCVTGNYWYFPSQPEFDHLIGVNL
ncbi:unnamed protein product [Schistosoma turkestanicum]|nr:unnamed protein product [Schistosoma turkestanicum]